MTPPTPEEQTMIDEILALRPRNIVKQVSTDGYDDKCNAVQHPILRGNFSHDERF